MAKIALKLEQALEQRAQSGSPGRLAASVLAQGDGWTVRDVVCTSGPHDRAFEEQHGGVAIAIVVAGSFQYRSNGGGNLMTPGAVLLGNPGQYFECRHQHAAGDRCISFQYDPDYFLTLADGDRPHFPTIGISPCRDLSAVAAKACAGLSGSVEARWEELSIALAGRTVELAGAGSARSTDLPAGAVARVTRVVRRIERHAGQNLTVPELAREAGLSPYHFLRVFESMTGLTPHQYLMRARLRDAAVRLVDEPGKILDIAFDCGFQDVSNFNRAFRAEFGVSPRAYRAENHGSVFSREGGRPDKSRRATKDTTRFTASWE
ncbi:MAG TPA: AraC family transcriptional regulator [Terriglobales bacterium]|nr:AraC family transcriptional regulator [Terriglobales bacterium]